MITELPERIFEIPGQDVPHQWRHGHLLDQRQGSKDGERQEVILNSVMRIGTSTARRQCANSGLRLGIN